MTAEWKALREAVNTLLQRAAAVQGMVNQHEFLPADTDAEDIAQTLYECDHLVRRAFFRCEQWRAVRP